MLIFALECFHIEPAKLRALRALVPTRLTHHQYTPACPCACAPYSSLIWALSLINRRLTRICHDLLLLLKGGICFVCALQLIFHLSFSSPLLYHIKLFCMLFSFFCFKLLVTPLFLQRHVNNKLLVIPLFLQQHVSKLEERGNGLFDFHFISKFLKEFLKS